MRFPGTADAYGVRIVGENSENDDAILLLGFFGRIFGDFTPPRDLVKVLAARSVQRRRPSSAPETGAPPTRAGGGAGAGRHCDRLRAGTKGAW